MPVSVIPAMRWLTVCALLPLFGACGASVSGDAGVSRGIDGSGGNSAGGSSVNTGGGNGNGTPSAAAGQPGDDNPPVASAGQANADPTVQCTDYDDPEAPDPVTFTVTNRLDATIALGNADACQREYLSIDSDTAETPGSWHGSHCLFSCSHRNDIVGCTGDCPAPAPLFLMPGESEDVEWRGVVAREVALPSLCCNDPTSCSAECSLVEIAAPGTYRATVAFVELTDEQVTACGGGYGGAPGAGVCPVEPGGQNLERVEIPFTLGDGRIELRVER